MLRSLKDYFTEGKLLYCTDWLMVMKHIIIYALTASLTILLLNIYEDFKCLFVCLTVRCVVA